jgi:hypothetical protein
VLANHLVLNTVGQNEKFSIPNHTKPFCVIGNTKLRVLANNVVSQTYIGMMEIIETIQRSVFVLYNLLPVVLMITLFTLGIGLGNYGMISIFFGQAAVAAIVLFSRYWNPFNSATMHELFSLIPNESSVQFPSMWIAQITFFFTCLLINASNILNKTDPANGSDPVIATKVYSRKARSTMIIVTCVLLFMVMVGYRSMVEYNSSLGSIVGILISVSMGAAAGTVWWAASSSPTIGIKNMDIFGISQQLIRVNQTDRQTMCQLVAR